MLLLGDKLLPHVRPLSGSDMTCSLLSVDASGVSGLETECNMMVHEEGDDCSSSNMH